MKKIVKFLCAVSLVFAFLVSPVQAANYKPDKVISSNIALLMNLDDAGKTVLYSKNADLRSAPASLTKIITVGVILDQVKDLDNTMVTVSENAIAQVQGTNSSVAGLIAGETMSMHILLYHILMQSANEGCIVAAEHVAGSEAKFVEMMNAYVQKLGCKNTQMKNCHGLDEDGHYTTASDLAVIIQDIMSRHPEFMQICNNYTYTFPDSNKQKGKQVTSTNELLNPYRPAYYYEYAKGIKTGTTTKAGKCLASTASKNGYNYLCIIMQGSVVNVDGDNIPKQSNFSDTKKLYEWAFSNFKFTTVASAQTVAGTVKVNNAKGLDEIQLVPQTDVSALVPSNIDASSVLVEVDKEKTPGSVDAPLKKGDVVGEAKVIYGNQEIARVKLVAADDVKRSALLFAWNTAKKLLSTVWAKLVLALLGLLVVAYIIINILYNRKKRRNRIRVVKNYRDM